MMAKFSKGPAVERKQTGFRIEKNLLKQFQQKLFALDQEMSPVIESWISEYMAGARALPGTTLPAAGTCPVCESQFRMTPEGAELVKTGPIESLQPGTIPDELVPLVLKFLACYVEDPIFAQTVNGIITIATASKK